MVTNHCLHSSETVRRDWLVVVVGHIPALDRVRHYCGHGGHCLDSLWHRCLLAKKGHKMSIGTWKRGCGITKMPGKKASDLEMLEWELRQWLGCRRAVLKRHGLYGHRNNVTDGSVGWYPLTSEHSPLCRKYREPLCEQCPVCLSRNGNGCTVRIEGEEAYRPWAMWWDNANPGPMISAIRKAIRWVKARDKKAQKKGVMNV